MRGYGFGDYRLFPDLQLLCRGAGTVPLPPTALRVLALLVEHHGRVVTKDEFMKKAWFGSAIEENNLAIQVSVLRKALGPNAIRSVYGRGYQLAVPVVPLAEMTEPPAAAGRNRAAVETNLPRPLSTVIGREADLAELVQRVTQNRLVTLAGPGGVGKTRLAIELGWQLAESYADDVWLIDLAPLRDPDLIGNAAATVLDVAVRAGETPAEAIAAAIRKRRLLLVFDNCEYLAAAAGALIATLLGRAPGLSVVVTSQEILGVAGEQIHRLEPLAVPPADGADIAGFAATDLFVERARAAVRHFSLEADKLRDIAAICRALEGMPLALEMAAALLPLLGLDGLRARLDQRLNLFAAGPRAGDMRGRTLRAVMEWSHGLLAAPEQRLFRRLAVFSGGFSLDAAVAVASAAGSAPWPIIEGLGRLIDKSMVSVEPSDPPRYRLLETPRLYALERLLASGEQGEVAALHARHFTDMFSRSDGEWETTSDRAWLEKYQPEIDNIRAALDWLLAHRDRARSAVALAGWASRLFELLSYNSEGRRYAERVLPILDQGAPDTAARFLTQAGSLLFLVDRARALHLVERSVALYRDLDAPCPLAIALSTLGSLYVSAGRYREAGSVLAEAQGLLTASGHSKSMFGVATNLGILASCFDKYVEARQFYSHALSLARILKDRSRENHILVNLAELDFQMNAVDRAIEHGRLAVSGLRSSGRRSHLGMALVNLSSYLAVTADLADARALAEEAYTLSREMGGFLRALCLQQWALLGALDGRLAEAARLIGFVDAGFAASGDSREPTEQQCYDRLLKLLAEQLSPEDIQLYRAEGARWQDDQAEAYVADHLIRPVGRC